MSEKMNFLVIDDDPADIELIRQYLREIPKWNIHLISRHNTQSLFDDYGEKGNSYQYQSPMQNPAVTSGTAASLSGQSRPS